MARYDLSEVEWRIVEPLLPPVGKGKRREDDRRIVNGVFHVLRTGSPWRDLPERYGPRTTVYSRFNRRAKKGVWLRMFEALAERSAHAELLASLSITSAVVADRGYDSRAIIDPVAARGGEAHIPTRSRVKVQRSVEPGLYRKRSLIERYFCNLKQLRSIATRFEKLARNFLAAVALASARLWLRSIESTP
jgi:transposase